MFYIPSKIKQRLLRRSQHIITTRVSGQTTRFLLSWPERSTQLIETRVLDAAEIEFSDAKPELSVGMPCLNEAETLANCINLIQRTVHQHNIYAEVLVADNGSTDGSIEITKSNGARVVPVAAKGYGNALMGGIQAARGKYAIMGNADMNYDFGDIPKVLAELRKGDDLVMGNRFRGGINPGAMPPSHRILGNPVLTAIGRLFFSCPAKDFHCGLRGFSKDAYARMNLRTTGMEFAREVVVKASLFGMRINEVPTTLQPDRHRKMPLFRLCQVEHLGPCSIEGLPHPIHCSIRAMSRLPGSATDGNLTIPDQRSDYVQTGSHLLIRNSS
jgi:hypothetical protein